MILLMHALADSLLKLAYVIEAAKRQSIVQSAGQEEPLLGTCACAQVAGAGGMLQTAAWRALRC
jgi:hypothetical protein